MAIEQVAGVVLGLVVGVAVGGWLQRDRSSVRAVERRLTGLAAQLDDWQRAHDVRQDELDRRLARLEESAARAENETRMLSGMLVEGDTGPHPIVTVPGQPRRAG